ncbi:MAG: GTPase HflX [Acidimicrobiia bacterium]|nr:GTPase HflX [Acidimicrobiia bacterium]MDH4305856.1 GTPase HflX [Acidimicrobiia bacterium]MDH5292504.1 GTPase HflX [Acidimicrobiia bacterium]
MTYDHQARGRRRLTATVTDLEVVRQKAFLVGVAFPDTDVAEAERSLDELALLTDTAGSDPVDSELVRRRDPDPATFIGSGKAQELAELTRALDIDLVVFDNTLTPAQQRNLQKKFEVDVVDREALILDIFAQHATSKAGAIQVELALYRYNLPRLRGRGKHMSQQGYGVLARGPGETKLETDRRRILARISRLERDLKAQSRTRATQRKSRHRNDVPQVALVGYTNAGKSTLLNRLTSAEVLAEDRLFSTLDSTVRRSALPDGRFVLLSDTVGFVRRLPHQLVEAFRSTLEDVTEADLLLHLVDASDPDPAGQIAAVRTVLAEIDANSIPEILVFNKADLADPLALGRLRNVYPDSVTISARTGDGVDDLLHAVAEQLAGRLRLYQLLVPYDRGDIVAAAHRLGEVVLEKHTDDGTYIDVRLQPDQAGRFESFQTE